MTELRWPDVLGRLTRSEDLPDDLSSAAMRAIMQGEASPAQVAGFVIGLRTKGETDAEIASLVQTMRSFATPVHVDEPVVDTCGTGGDGAGTFNISTLAALVAAGAGAKVAKHGNRAASGRCGTADLLEHWGVAIDLDADGVAACIEQVGIGFCFAPSFHPSMRHAMPARRELGVPTVFNFLGPLTNPAGAAHQTVGVSDPVMAPKVAGVLARLGTAHALVFHGDQGLDELSTTGPSQVWEVTDGTVRQWTLDPAELGFAPATLGDLAGGDLDRNRAIADEVLDGRPGAKRDIVVLGAAAALVAADLEFAWPDAVERASAAIEDGSAAQVLQRWVATSKKLAAT